MIRIALLGSTGSIGTSTLNVVRRHRERFRPVALVARSNLTLLREQMVEWQPAFAALVDGEPDTGMVTGAAALIEAATRDDVDVVVNAVVGAAGLEATLAALRAGKRVALANKETLVTAGPLVAEAAKAGGGSLVPVDSEHSAVLQCLTGNATPPRRIILTASGGPFRTWDPARLNRATVDEALNHPTWSMGAKITIDSATLANKALEIIEAHFLFGLPYDAIDAVVHPESIVHAFVEFVDGSVLAQVGVPTMETPILYALTHPERLEETDRPAFDPVAAGDLHFEAIRSECFPAFALGVAAGRAGGTAPAVFNGANEVAVAAFLDRRITFGRIPALIESALARHTVVPASSLEAVQHADTEARRLAEESI